MCHRLTILQGNLYILPREKVRKIEKLTAGEAMKYAVTGGVVDLDDEAKDETVPQLKKS